MTKRKKRTPAVHKKENSKLLTYIVGILIVIVLILSSLVAGYYFGYADAKEDISKLEKQNEKKRLEILKKLEKVSTHKETDTVNNRLKEVLKKEQKYSVSAAHEYEDASVDNEIVNIVKKQEPKLVGVKPKLAIIIDDVSVKSQVAAIKSLNIPITMSFLPPSLYRPNSPKLAARENLYMVHLPMEAKNFTKEEPFTLRVDDSEEAIEKRIDDLVALFPKVQYINNHTGSKFTSDEAAMNRLIYALNKRGISFIDSRTTAATMAPKVMKNFGLKYMARDVFLDHEMEKDYVKKQIKLAVKHAKQNGYSIAIGHPHPNTLMALHESKNLLQEVDLVYINKL